MEPNRPPQEPWIPLLSPKQLDVFNSYERYVLCAGGRKNGKTIAVGHKVMRHLWEIPGARVGLIAKTIRSAKEGGAWTDMLEIVVPQWIDANIAGPDGFPLEYTTRDGSGTPGPRMDSATRTSSFRIRNYWGGESEIILISLDNDEDVEAKMKSLRFSMIWVSELAHFKIKKVFTALIQQLRMFHLRREQHQLIADTNPAEEGEESWIYQLFWVERNMKDHPNPKFQKNLRLFEFHLEDNPWLTPEDIEELKGSNSDNQGEYDRNVLGKWTKGFGLKGKIFGDIFVPNIHIIDPAIEVAKDNFEMLSGWDMGQVNYSFHIIEKRIFNNMTHYLVLEELVKLHDRITTADFAFECWEMMRRLEQLYERTFKWTHWSDETALNHWRGDFGGVDAQIVANVTNQEVQLFGADKPKQSVMAGIKLIRMLMKTNRFYVGKNCPVTCQMLSDISENDLEHDTDFVHSFDSMRYPIYMEERHSLVLSSRPAPRPSTVIHY